METSEAAGHQPPASSTMTVFTFVEPGEPLAIVIGPTHAPYYVFEDGRTEAAAPSAPEA